MVDFMTLHTVSYACRSGYVSVLGVVDGGGGVSRRRSIALDAVRRRFCMCPVVVGHFYCLVCGSLDCKVKCVLSWRSMCSAILR